MIIRRGVRPLARRQLHGMGEMGLWETLLASPQVQQAATQTAGNLLTTVGEGLVSVFGGGDSTPPPPPPPPKPTIPTWVPIVAVGGLAALLLLRK